MESFHPLLMKQEPEEPLPLLPPPQFHLPDNKPVHIHDIPYMPPAPTTGRLLCDLCGFRTNEKTHLRQHIGHRHLPRDLPCPDCGKLMNTTIMDHHRRIHMKDHICEKCGKRFPTIRKLRIHNERITSCVPKTQEELERDPEYIAKKYKCASCPYRGATSKLLNRHMHRVHRNKDAPKDKICPICNKQMTIHQWKNHERMHKKIQCKICFKWMSASSNYFKTHMKNHERPPDFPQRMDGFPYPPPDPETGLYKCTEDGCTYATQKKRSFSHHWYNVHAPRDQLCNVPGCKSGPMNKRQLWNHTVSVHKPRPKCEKCGAVYRDPRDLKRHIERNACKIKTETESEKETNEKVKIELLVENTVVSEVEEDENRPPLEDDLENDMTIGDWKDLQCSECDYKTDKIKLLTQHFARNHGTKDHRCTFYGCKNENLMSKKQWQLHMRWHSTTFKCDQCDSGFPTKRVLDRHIRRVHELGQEDYDDDPLEEENMRNDDSGSSSASEDSDSGSENYSNKYKCTQCNYKSKRKNLLTRHYKVNHGPKEFACEHPDCKNRPLMTRQQRDKHMIVHKKAVCHGCGNEYEERYIKKHIEMNRCAGNKALGKIKSERIDNLYDLVDTTLDQQRQDFSIEDQKPVLFPLPAEKMDSTHFIIKLEPDIKVEELEPDGPETVLIPNLDIEVKMEVESDMEDNHSVRYGISDGSDSDISINEPEILMSVSRASAELGFSTDLNQDEQCEDDSDNDGNDEHDSMLKIERSLEGYDSNLFPCEVCDYVAKKKNNLRDHVLTMHAPKDRECPHCGRMLSRRAFRKHVKTHLREYECILCNYQAASRYNLRYHIEKSHPSVQEPPESLMRFNGRVVMSEIRVGSAEYQCAHCEYVSPSRKYFIRHYYRRHATYGSQICPVCSKSINKIHFSTHLNRHENEKNRADEKYMCEKCSRIFKQPRTLSVHMVTCNGIPAGDKSKEDLRYECNMCDYKTYRRNYLYHHKKVVHDPKDSECPTCHKMFSKKQLKKHMPTHSRNYECPVCAKRMTSRWHLKAHINALHPDNEEAMEEFKVDLRFNKNDFITQLIASTTALEMHCPICGKMVKRLKLRAHMRCHDKRHICQGDGCGKRFADVHALRKHQGKCKTIIKIEPLELPQFHCPIENV